jgi:hypothetical protein
MILDHFSLGSLATAAKRRQHRLAEDVNHVDARRILCPCEKQKTISESRISYLTPFRCTQPPLSIWRGAKNRQVPGVRVALRRTRFALKVNFRDSLSLIVAACPCPSRYWLLNLPVGYEECHDVQMDIIRPGLPGDANGTCSRRRERRTSTPGRYKNLR